VLNPDLLDKDSFRKKWARNIGMVDHQDL